MVKFCFGTSNATYILSDYREMLVLDVHFGGELVTVFVLLDVKAFTFVFGSYLSWHLWIVCGSLKLTDMNEHF